MNSATDTHFESITAPAVSATKRVILSIAGKGGVGNTTVIAGLAEWFQINDIPVQLFDLATENGGPGSLTHIFGRCVSKLDIHAAAGLDAFIDHLTDGPAVILADMDAGSGQVTHDWFDAMYPDLAHTAIVFTAIGVVTADPGSVSSVLAWADRLQRRVRYLIVENSISPKTDFTHGAGRNRRSSSSTYSARPSSTWSTDCRILKMLSATTASRWAK
jgi:MinD-like ATPase involved in chromosome partitioning or flagellar assembly